MSVRDRWATLTARERDAEVAKAKGARIQLLPAQYPMPESQEPMVFDHDLRILVSIPHYSTSWADAGPLLEELVREHYESAELFCVPAGHGHGEQWTIDLAAVDPHRCCDLAAESALSVVALAYCVAKEKP